MQAGDIAASAETTIPPPALEERFKRLLQDAGSAVRCGCVAVQTLSPEKGDRPAAGAADPASEELESADVPLTADNVEAVEGMFDSSVGTNVENEQIRRFLRAAVIHSR